MKISGAWVVDFAGVSVAIDWWGEKSLEVLEFLFEGVRTKRSGNGSGPKARFELRTVERDSIHILRRDNELLYQGPSRGEAAAVLLDWTIHDLADACRSGPLFHAAALSFQGRGILLPARSGSGKTTLAAWMSGRGYNYLTDELACIEGKDFNLRAFYRPLHVKTPAPAEITRSLAQEIDSTINSDHKLLPTEQGLLVHPSHIKMDNVYDTPEVRTIVFPHYQPGAEFCLKPISKANASLLLMDSLVNARNLPGHGLAEISRLARSAPAFSLTYGGFDQIGDGIL